MAVNYPQADGFPGTLLRSYGNADRDMTTSETLFFVHVPKTAGQTFISILENQYPSAVTRVEPDRETDPKWQNIGEDAQRAQRSGAAVIVGHFRFGVHRWIEGPYRYVTFLRDPVDRVISHYHFALERPGIPGDDRLRALTEGELEEAVTHPDVRQLQNFQTRLLAGFDDEGRPFPAGRSEEETLARAKENLDRCAVVGLTERFDESIALMKLVFGWKTPVYARENPTTRRPTVDAVPQRLVALIEERNQLDRALYQHGENLLESALARHRTRIAWQLARLRLLNTVHPAMSRLSPRARRVTRKARRTIRHLRSRADPS